MPFVFPPQEQVAVPIAGRDERLPVHRVYCVGRNFADHAREMGSDPQREPPFFFSKPADAVVNSPVAGVELAVPYPSRTHDLQHEIELVVALGCGGSALTPHAAAGCVFGYAVGLDLTRRDLQAQAKALGRPWDTAKGFDYSAPLSRVIPLAQTGWLEQGAICLKVNGVIRQQGDIADMIWNVAEIVAELSALYHLVPGDLIFTGTPSGVGPVQPDDVLDGSIEGVGSLQVRIK